MAELISAGAEFATEGERLAAEVLKTLPDDWFVLANKVLPTQAGNSYEIDFIVVGRRLVFVIDEKSWRGRIHGSDAIWVRDDGSSERSPLTKVDYVAKVVAGRLRDNVPNFRDIQAHTVVGCVLLSHAEERPRVHDPRAAKGVMLLADVVEHLHRRDEKEGDPRVGHLRDRIKGVLYNLSDRPRFPRVISPYTIIEMTMPRDSFYSCQAEHPEAGRRQLAVYNVAGKGTVDRTFYFREFHALKQLQNTGVAVAALDPFEWSDDFLVVPFERPVGTSVGAMPQPTSQVEALRQIRWAAAAFRALARVHNAKVVHRAISPDTVFVADAGENSAVMLTGFFAARLGTQTISVHLDDLHLIDPYAAPEIAQLGSYGFAEPSSDAFSLGLVFLERMSGMPVEHLRSNDALPRIPDPGEGWPYLPLDAAEGLGKVFRSILTLGPLAPFGTNVGHRPSAIDIAKMFDAVVQPETKGDELDASHLLDKRYRVVRSLGEGAFARTMLAEDTEASGRFVLKQFLRPDDSTVFQQARQEFETLRGVDHPSLPRVFDVYPRDHDVHVKLEYVEGARLRNCLSWYMGNLDRCRQLADDLIGAVEHLEIHHLLHRDIKPENIVIRDDSRRAVLVDFGSSAAAGQPTEVSGTPQYLPPEAFTADQPPTTIDRYAIAFVLFEALTGTLPFAEDDHPLSRRLRTELDGLATVARPFARILLKALANDPAERYPSVLAFRNALEGVTSPSPELNELINPWVDQLRSLFRNSSRGNAENRGLDTDFARKTYVPTSLDERLLPAILEQWPRAVFLSGNPGDGKTAFLEQVRNEIDRRNGNCRASDESGWEYELDGHVIRACYDASEAHKGKSADEQLLERMRGLEGDDPPQGSYTALVAINDGRLAAVFEQYRETFGWLAAEVHRAHDPAHPLETGGVWLLDLKRRAYVSLEPTPTGRSVMRRVLEALIAPSQWNICTRCMAREVCPVRANATELSDAETSRRLEHVLLLSYLRAQRHVTMRDLRSGLAYLVTGDLSCERVHEISRTGQEFREARFWHTAFTTPADRDILLGEMTALDPGRFPQPHLERFFFFHQTVADSLDRAQRFRDGKDVRPSVPSTAWLSDVKRRLYFYGDDKGGSESSGTWLTLLPYQHASRFINTLSGLQEPDAFLASLARGLGRSDGLTGTLLFRGLCLSVASSDVNRLTVVKEFPLEEFDLTVPQAPGSNLVEAIPRILLLSHRKTAARLELDLDTFEFLLRLASGMEPTSHELQPLLEDLAPFKSAVQLSSTRDLVLIEAGRHFHRLTQRDGKVVRELFEPLEPLP
jgi:serine/threonine protein kinase